MPIFVTEQLGPTQHLTPEGYLLCVGVPIARIGSQIYAAHELPTLEAGRDGLITVHREESEVFHPDTIASFEGKSATINHTFVDPNNVKRVEVGHAQNVRRSEIERDLLVADLLIKDARAIDLVRDGEFREISCGYDAEYVQVSPGVAYQRNIVGNHVALVKRGRAGPRCSIQDEEPETMTTKKPGAITALFARMMRAVRTGDAELIRKTADEVAEEEMRIADEEREEEMRAKDEEIEGLKAELEKTQDAASVEACIEMCKQLSPEDREKVIAGCKRMSTGDAGEELDENGQPKAKTGDNKHCDEDEEEKQKTADAMRDIASRAEILVPGFAMPTADSAPRRLADVAVVQRKVLADAMKTEDGKEIVAPLLAGRTVDAMSADAVATVFVAAAEVARQKNNARGSRPSVKTRDFGATVTAAEINRRNAEFYANQK